MLRGYRRFITTAVGCLGFSIALWLAFSPRQPYLPFYSDPKPNAAEYHPGGSNCRPEVLAALVGKKAASEANRCAESAEEHRLNTNDLTQQSRAADAAQSSAWTGYEATRIALMGLIGGFLTLVAAGFAAYYARRAYLETKRTADLAKDTLEIETRPFLYLEEIEWEEIPTPDTGGISFALTALLKNVGHLPATNINVWIAASTVAPEDMEDYSHVFDYAPLNLPICPPGVVRRVYYGIALSKEESARFDEMKLGIAFAVKVEFDTRFIKGVTIEERRWGDAYNMREAMRLFHNPPNYFVRQGDLFEQDDSGDESANHRLPSE